MKTVNSKPLRDIAISGFNLKKVVIPTLRWHEGGENLNCGILYRPTHYNIWVEKNYLMAMHDQTMDVIDTREIIDNDEFK